MQLHRYEECLYCCDQALTVISKFHSNNDVWLRRLKIKSLLKLERVADAKAVFKELLTGKFNSWIIYEIGYTIAVAENNQNDALKYIGSCALADNSHQMRVKFYIKSAEFLYQHGFEHIGMLQVHLADLIRAENKWKAQKNQYEWNVIADIAALTKKTVLQELKKFWQAQRDKDKMFLEGTVKTVLSSGRSGFIVGESGFDYFFSMSDVKSNCQQLKSGSKVRFTIIKRLDRKKIVCQIMR